MTTFSAESIHSPGSERHERGPDNQTPTIIANIPARNQGTHLRNIEAVLPHAVRNTFDMFYCALSQLPSRYQSCAHVAEVVRRKTLRFSGTAPAKSGPGGAGDNRETFGPAAGGVRRPAPNSEPFVFPG